jgi:hypothetical protein
MHIASIGIDLGKTTFHLVALGERSKVLFRKKFSRTQLLTYTANLRPSSYRYFFGGSFFLNCGCVPTSGRIRLSDSGWR